MSSSFKEKLSAAMDNCNRTDQATFGNTIREAMKVYDRKDHAIRWLVSIMEEDLLPILNKGALCYSSTSKAVAFAKETLSSTNSNSNTNFECSICRNRGICAHYDRAPGWEKDCAGNFFEPPKPSIPEIRSYEHP